jgi:hypothetical protein
MGRLLELVGLEGRDSLGSQLIYSGSYVMPYVLADQHSWLEKGKDPFDFKVLNTFENMINSVRYVITNVSLIM